MKHRQKKALFLSIVILAFILLVSYLAVPPIVKTYALERVSKALNRQVSVESVNFNPLSLGLTLRGFKMQEPDGRSLFVSFDELYVNVEVESLLRGALVIKELALVNPYAAITLEGANKYNFSDLLKSQEKADNRGDFRFSVNNIQISKGRIVFKDMPNDAVHNITDIEIALPFISNMPHYEDSRVMPSFSAHINNRAVSFIGNTKPFHNSLETDFAIKLTDIDIPYYLNYLPKRPNFIMDSGTLSADIKLFYIQHRDKPPSVKVTGAVSVSNLDMKDKKKAALINLNNFGVNIADSDLIARSLHLSKVAVDSPRINLLLSEGGRLNLMEIFPPDKEESKPFTYEVDEIDVSNGEISFLDKERSFSHGLKDITVSASGFTNLTARQGTFKCTMVSGMKESVLIEGTSALEPLAIKGAVKLSDIIINKYEPLYRDKLNLNISSGKADISGGFEYSGGDLLISGLSASVNSLRLKTLDDRQEFGNITAFNVSDLSMNLSKKEIIIGGIQSSKARFVVLKRADGSLNLDKLINEDDDANRDDDKWDVVLKRLSLQGYDVSFEDMTKKNPVHLSLSSIAIDGSNLSIQEGRKGRLRLSLNTSDKGRLAIDSTVMLNPLTLEGTLNLKGFDLSSIREYLTERLRIMLLSGDLHLNGRYSAALADKAVPRLSYLGNVSVTGLYLLDSINSEDLLKWENLYIKEMELKNDPLVLSVNDIALSDFFSRIIINEQKRLNLQDIAVVDSASLQEVKDTVDKQKAPETTPKPQSEESKITIGSVTLQKGVVYFTDRHVKPNFSARLTGLSGAISGLTSMDDKPADIDIRGSLEDYAPLHITGKINPLRKDLYLDIKADFRDMGMTSLNPYSARYLGYAIDKGKLSFDVRYHIENGGLDSENNVLLDQLTLGDKIESPDATKLPVKLAIALLKDRRGEIKLDIPVKGSLRDPQFSLGGIIIKILINLLLKAATSPFALLGAMFGGGEEMSFIEFDYGLSEIRQDQGKKIDMLLKALSERPALKLDIKGTADIERDKEGIKRLVFEKKIKAQKLKELVEAGTKPPPIDQIKIEPQEHLKYLTAAYKAETFPKPRNIIGIAKTLPKEEMEKLMLSHITVTDSDLRQLASERASVVHKRLMESNLIARERMFLLEPVVTTGEEDKKPEKSGSKSRVDFLLK